ncbi:hypothetical protein B5E64_02520 [Drancourtella sp. An12]|uniref:toll/interleukin-1 receptor domain-containing protein n=1 Tax=Drancourtella sp. An12 TaxID=1965548 RepID=UPI000B39436C|nr:toll/interleukin-1 receptor domain-containing protein [Drancourtella sp. An12]OUQ46913.1 hypothetical protein B5E64_02520 [Drancourtella sp. An12]
MLFILFGGTLEVGFQSRKILQDKGFAVIKKYNLIEADSPISDEQYKNPEGVYKDWFNDKIYVTKEEYRKCDFKYGLNGVAVGFNQQQIMDAIHGVNDCILTIGTYAIEFIEQLKRAYGDYVTLINLFIDDPCYEKLIAAQPGITDEEIEARMVAGKRMQQIYLSDFQLFDEVVIYTGEGTSFDYKALEKQFDQIVNRRKKLELVLNEQKYVKLPYVGPEPYIFVSYSHQDREQVYSILGMLQRNGFRIWYDEGITGGANWRLMIKDRIKCSECMLLFSSADAVGSTAVTIEITTANNFEIPIICVSLDTAQFDETIEEELNRNQKLFCRDDFGTFENKVIEALPENCRV